MNRRRFLAFVGGAVVMAPAACRSSASVRTGAGRRLRSVGVQLYSLRDDARRDLAGTLAAIAEIGYSDVELLGSMANFGMPPAQLRRVLDDNGLRASSTHVGGSALDDLERQLDEAQTLGHRDLIIASLPIQGQRTLDDYRRWSDRLNDAGQRTLSRGIHIGFHNHANDHTPIDGVVPYDLLVERTEPGLVRLQLDTGNTAMAGHDPLEYLRRYGDRYWSFHIKDVPRLGATSDTELGQGVIDLRRLLAGISDIENKLLYVEQETYPGTPLESVRRDYSYITSLEF